MSCGFSGRLTLKVASAADFPGPTRLHLEPKAERELAWAAIWCLPTAAISVAVQLWWDEGAAAPGSDGEVSRGALYTRCESLAHMLEDGGGKSLRHPEERGRTAGGSDMKGSSGPGEWISLQKQQHTGVCQWWDLYSSLPRILIASLKNERSES